MTAAAGESLWQDLPSRPDARAPLDRDVEVDVVVVGAGITGATLAWKLAGTGRRVLLLESRRIGAAVTGGTTAKVTALHGARYHSLARRHGASAASDYAAAQQAGLRQIRELVGAEGIECDLETLPSWTYATSEQEAETIRREHEAAQEAGLDTDLMTETPLPFRVNAAVRLDDQAQFHPVRYLDGAVAAAEARGAEVCEHTAATELHERGGLRVSTSTGHTVRARDVAVTTHYPLFDRALLFPRVTVQREFALSARAGGHVVPGMFYGLGPEAPSVRAAGDELVFSGEHFRPGTGSPADRLGRFERTVRSRFDRLGEATHRWAAQDVYSHDGLPYVGRMLPWNEHVHVATGFAAWGMTNGVAAALAIAGRIEGDPPDWATRFDPMRLMGVSGIPKMLTEQATVARHFVGDRVTRGHDLEGLAPGKGAVVRVDGHPCAAFRDDDGVVHKLDARCTHLGCLVGFNDAERVWECPCHGSRFGLDGRVLNGPATQALRPRD